MNFISKLIFGTVTTIGFLSTPASANWSQFHELVGELQSIPAVQQNYANMCRERYGMITSTGYKSPQGPYYQWCLSTYGTNVNPW
jgi:hypothetical protein